MERMTKIILALAIAAVAGVVYLVNFNQAVAGPIDRNLNVQTPPEPLEVNIVAVSNPNTLFKTIIAEKEVVSPGIVVCVKTGTNCLADSQELIGTQPIRDINIVVEIIEKVTPPLLPGPPAQVITLSKTVELLICDKTFVDDTGAPGPPKVHCFAVNMVPPLANADNTELPPAIDCFPERLEDPIAMATAFKDFNIKQSLIKTVKVEKEVLNCRDFADGVVHNESNGAGLIFDIFVIEEIIEQPGAKPPNNVPIKRFENVICVKDTSGNVRECQITSADGRTQIVVPDPNTPIPPFPGHVW